MLLSKATHNEYICPKTEKQYFTVVKIKDVQGASVHDWLKHRSLSNKKNIEEKCGN